MKKFLATFLTAAMMAIMVPLAANAQSRSGKRANRDYRYSQQQDKNFYQRHRNLINIGIGGVAGAVVGGLIGGKKGALIGAGVGAGSGAAYTYGINPKDKKKERRYYRRP